MMYIQNTQRTQKYKEHEHNKPNKNGQKELCEDFLKEHMQIDNLYFLRYSTFFMMRAI